MRKVSKYITTEKLSNNKEDKKRGREEQKNYKIGRKQIIKCQ